MLGTDAGVVQSCTYRVGSLHLPRLFILQEIRSSAVQDTRRTASERSTTLGAIAIRLRSINGDALVLSEGVEHAYRVRPAADARDDRIR